MWTPDKTQGVLEIQKYVMITYFLWDLGGGSGGKLDNFFSK